MASKRKSRIQNYSQVPNRSGEEDVRKPEMERVSINFAKLEAATKPNKLRLVWIEAQTVRG